MATTAQAAPAFLVGDRASATTRICTYQYMGTEYSVTIPLLQMCPLTIEVRQ